ncbi:MAG TPA: hypothetical protein VNK24_00315 [Elusimicrobiota bacterium]|nr:hypothetical protein [Elusimicrobiota bacterium]
MNEAFAAYNAGDFAKAFQLIFPFAERGDAKAQSQFPGYPAEKRFAVPTRFGPLVTTTYSVTVNHRAYSAMCATYPAGADFSNPRVNLNGSVNGAARATQGTVLTSNYVNFEGYQGVDFVVQIKGGYSRNLNFLIGRTLYAIEMISPSNDFSDFGRFASSFQLMRSPGRALVPAALDP